MKKIYAVVESWNDQYDWWNPNTLPPDWINFIHEENDMGFAVWKQEAEHAKHSYTQDPLIKYKITKHSLINHQIEIAKENLQTIFYSELPPNKNYVYPVRIHGLSWLPFFIEHEFNFVNPNILKDIQNEVASLVFYHPAEGHLTQEDFDTLTKILAKYKIPKAYYYHNNYKIVGNETLEYWCSADFLNWVDSEVLEPIKYEPANEKNIFLNYNRKFAVHRLKLLIELHKNNLQDKGYWSYTNLIDEKGKRKQSEYFLTTQQKLLEINDPNYFIINDKDKFICKQLDDMSPVLIDRPLRHDDPTNYVHDVGDINLYQQTFLSLVSETLYSHKHIFISEKILKPIIIGHPFIVNGSPLLLKQLKLLGFKTFDKWIDESYDIEENFELRLIKIITVLKYIASLDIEALKNIRKEMLPVLEYNQKHFKFLQKHYNMKDIIINKLSEFMI